MLDAASKLVSLGVTRVLTSGGCADALTGAPAIRAMQQMYGDRIHVLAGGGVRAGNILRLVEETGVSRVHLGGTAQVSDPSTLLNPTLNFGSSLPPSNDCYLAVNETTRAGSHAGARAVVIPIYSNSILRPPAVPSVRRGPFICPPSPAYKSVWEGSLMNCSDCPDRESCGCRPENCPRCRSAAPGCDGCLAVFLIALVIFFLLCIIGNPCLL